jgi:hypothetical protein
MRTLNPAIDKWMVAQKAVRTILFEGKNDTRLTQRMRKDERCLDVGINARIL